MEQMKKGRFGPYTAKAKVNEIKRESEEILKQLRRIESNFRFNALVSRVDCFLSEWEDFNSRLKASESVKTKESIPLCYKQLKTNRSLNSHFKLLGLHHGLNFTNKL